MVVAGHLLVWERLERLIEMTKSSEGRKWLQRCVLRIYAPEDYLIRWRRFFAQQLGFSYIPGGQEVSAKLLTSVNQTLDGVHDALTLDAWMREHEFTDEKLAARLGKSRSLISHYRSGRRTISRAFLSKLRSVMHDTSDSTGVSTERKGYEVHAASSACSGLGPCRKI